MRVQKLSSHRAFIGFAVFLSFLIFCAANVALASKTGRVLLVSSYHPGFPTFFQQVEGVKSVFSSKSIDLDIEFMDSKRFNTERNISNFRESLAYKLSKTPSYDLILAADDNALLFTLNNKEELFDGLPIIFFGVNNIETALAQNNNPKVTGVIEAVSMLNTLRLIKKLHPDAKNITALVDGTASGQSDLETFYQLGAELDDIELSEISLAELSFKEFTRELQQVPVDTNILLLSAYTDKNGENLLFHESLELIKTNLTRPVYHLWYHGMGDGVLGGKLISHFDQGAIAAKMALDILNGKAVEDIEVRAENPNRYVFDYLELERFGIDNKALPKASIVINKPYSFYEANKEIVWLGAVVISLLTAFIGVLLLNILRRQRAEKELAAHRDQLELLVNERTASLTEANETLAYNEKRYRTLSDAAFEGIAISEDGIIVEINDKIIEESGYALSELIGKPVDFLFPPEVKADLLEKMQAGYKKPYESLALKKDGTIIPVEIHAREFTYKERHLRVAAICDITERKKSEEELKELKEFLPIFAYCKKTRDDQGYWDSVESYISKHTGAALSHGICPDCLPKVYSEHGLKPEKNDKD